MGGRGRAGHFIQSIKEVSVGEETSTGRLHTYFEVNVSAVTCVFCLLGDPEGLVFYTLGPHRHFLHFLRHGGPAAQDSGFMLKALGSHHRTSSRSLHHCKSPWRQSRRTAWRRGAGAGLLHQGNVTGPEERWGQWLKEQQTGSGSIKKPGCQGSGLRLPGFKSQLLRLLPVRPAASWPVCFSCFSKRVCVPR